MATLSFGEFINMQAPFSISLVGIYLKYNKMDHLPLEGFEGVLTMENAGKAVKFFRTLKSNGEFDVDLINVRILYASLMLTDKLMATEAVSNFFENNEEGKTEFIIHNMQLLDNLQGFNAMKNLEAFNESIAAIEL